ncbi:MAG: diaminopimelate epimerase [Chloroflexi bacterium]|nr:diaminopimelate epimerase [Chloroflexota bacterium]
MKFTKMHGAGNDYVVVDARGEQRDWHVLARAMCNRHYGVGSDGLLLVVESSVADVRMRMFNPDGSEAEMCGNGIRCFAKYVLERRIVSPSGKGLRVETAGGAKTVVPLMEGGRVTSARVDMGEPRLRAGEIPVDVSGTAWPVAVAATLARDGQTARLLAGLGLAPGEAVMGMPLTVEGRTFEVTCVSMGNPHAVAFLKEPVDKVPLERLGPLVEHHPLFPKRVNFHVVNVLGQGTLRARHWERGAGLTLACGTGACAVAVASYLLGHTEATVEIEVPGGVLGVAWPGTGPVYLEGPAVEVFEGEWRG